MLEKSLCQPDRIVGELLQPGGYLMLKKMGLEDCTQDIDAQEVYGYALFKGPSAFNILYPTEGYDKDVAGRSFHHGRYERLAVCLVPNLALELKSLCFQTRCVLHRRRFAGLCND